MNITEKYCLKWNEFSLYICDSFKELRNDNNFCDVTLACDDGEQIKANKVVLSSCSPVLKNLLRSNAHPHPLLVLRGYTSQYLNQLIDFMYFGEVDVAQQDFDEFLRGAKDLQVKGLSEDKTYHQKPKQVKPVKSEKSKVLSSPSSSPPVKAEKPSSPKKILEVVKTKVSINPMMLDEVCAKQVMPPPQFNVTISPLDNIEHEDEPVTVKKQEEEEEEDAPECFDVSDSEETEMITPDHAEETYQEAPDHTMVVESRCDVETVQCVQTGVQNVSVETQQTVVTRSAVQPVTFAAIQTYAQLPQVEIYLPAPPAPPAPTTTSAPNNPTLQTRKKPAVVETMHKLREKEDDPILKMFSMRSAGGWTCTTCGQFSDHKTAMKVHIQTNHMSGFGHACDQCGKSFRTRGRLLSHIGQAHTTT